jgi:hypothetical protein
MPENRKPMYDVYQEYYERVGRSAAFSLYCERVFGVDLSQDGFSDMQQLDCMIALLGIGETDLCLDVGCGNGRKGLTIRSGQSRRRRRWRRWTGAYRSFRKISMS